MPVICAIQASFKTRFDCVQYCSDISSRACAVYANYVLMLDLDHEKNDTQKIWLQGNINF
jgi:hypothetical protein